MSTATLHPHTELVEACKAGDRLAQFRLYKLYNRAMFNICTRMLGDKAAAEDVLQEAFVSAFRNLHRFEGRSSFGAWIKRIVINKCLSHLNKRKAFYESLNENIHGEIPAENPGDNQPEISAAAIHNAIKSLPKGCRVIFTLYELEGYDHQEISDILKVSVSTSKSQFHRAKKLLQERLTAP